MTNVAEPELQATIQAWDQAWSLAALALAARDDSPPGLTAAASEVLAATGLTGAPGQPLRGLGASTPRQIETASQPRSPTSEARASLPEIGQVLRHRRQSTTAIHAKADVDALLHRPGTWSA